MKSGFNIQLVWIPSHKNISGNEIADREAKGALKLPLQIELKSHWYQIFNSSILESNNAWHSEHSYKIEKKANKLYEFNLIPSSICVCGHDFCDLRHIVWDCNQYIVTRQEIEDELNKIGLSLRDINSILASMNVQAIKLLCDFSSKTGIRI
ncbi:hypothetical protein TSAR_012792 [Trichomalopsis sarcophagae]|uniref:RNase H type-1 domain-containing protein n=1 Tax=Trichomalopsis sarcophagae TaxID=543379 RepID=A0A232EI70_9HYME|nr:hypothetical protein TSAR_012792 [Trichomalopsis sarcophagae]